jgi:hypothetical protein
MKHLVAIGVLVAVAFGVRAWLQTGFALDIPSIHRIVPLRIVVFWCLMGTAFIWLGILAWPSIRRHS